MHFRGRELVHMTMTLYIAVQLTACGNFKLSLFVTIEYIRLVVVYQQRKRDDINASITKNKKAHRV